MKQCTQSQVSLGVVMIDWKSPCIFFFPPASPSSNAAHKREMKECFSNVYPVGLVWF